MSYTPKLDAAEKAARKLGYRGIQDYMKRAIDSGQSDCAIARDFNVSRHTVRNWKHLLGIIVVKRARIKKERN